MVAQTDTIIIFEDERVTNLYPLTLTRPAWDLLCGTGTMLERIRRRFPTSKLRFWVREYMVPYVTERFPGIPVNQPPEDDGILINARLVDLSVLSDLPRKGSAVFHDGIPMIATFEANKISPWYQSGGTSAVVDGFNKGGEMPSTAVIDYPWDLVDCNETMIIQDAGSIAQLFDFLDEVDPLAVIRGRENARCDVGTRVGPYSVIDATTGPVILGKDVTIESHVLIQGPVYIGDRSLVRSHARVYGGTSVGPVCKVGGEIHGSVIHGFTNKQHDGFLGNSVVGSWCNLGAGTTISNLKNNYSPVRVQVGSQIVDTGRLFVGSMIGDHSATAIGTPLNTGTVIGVGCNVFGAGFPSRFIPSFHLGGAGSVERQSFEVAISAMETIMRRRGQVVSESYRQLLEYVYHMTEDDATLSTS